MIPFHLIFEFHFRFHSKPSSIVSTAEKTVRKLINAATGINPGVGRTNKKGVHANAERLKRGENLRSIRR